jgi:hypothetical protein
VAGSGEFTRTGNNRAECINLMGGITGGTAPLGEVVATLSGAATAGVITSLTCSAGTSKALPDEAILLIVDAAGTLGTIEAVCVNGAAAAAATSITVDSQTIKYTHAIGALVYLLAFTPYLALLISSAPTDNTLGTEYSQTGYARQLVPWTAPTAADPPVAANQGTITWGPLSGANGTDVVGYCALHDALSGGTIANRYAWWTFGATRTPNAGDSLQIAAAALTMQNYH